MTEKLNLPGMTRSSTGVSGNRVRRGLGVGGAGIVHAEIGEGRGQDRRRHGERPGASGQIAKDLIGFNPPPLLQVAVHR